MKNIYLSGPMRGHREFNFPAFDKAADKLIREGCLVFNPAERDRNYGFDEAGMSGYEPLHVLNNFDHRQAMADDTNFICTKADAIYMLPGWQRSTGAVAERALALALGLEVMYADPTDTEQLSLKGV